MYIIKYFHLECYYFDFEYNYFCSILNFRGCKNVKWTENIGKEFIKDSQVELKDSFGINPNELSNLIYVLRIKLICKKASIIRADVNPKGAIISFYKDYFPKPENLVSWIHKNRNIVKLRTDHKLVYMKKWDLKNLYIQQNTFLTLIQLIMQQLSFKNI